MKANKLTSAGYEQGWKSIILYTHFNLISSGWRNPGLNLKKEYNKMILYNGTLTPNMTLTLLPTEEAEEHSNVPVSLLPDCFKTLVHIM